MNIENIWNDWKVEKLIGEGSFGKVYKIVREDFGHEYVAALKVIHIPQSPAELEIIRNEGMTEESVTTYFKSMVEDIVEEFVLMSKLKGNSNIVSYEDHAVVSKKDGFGWEIFIRMELLIPLFDYLKNHTLTQKDVIQMGIDICQALEACQNYKIIHRDIKPENIFVSDLGKFKLGDFGIARQLEKTSSGMSKKGTFTYMAPEVYKGDSYNATVDIYSLGIVLYRFLNDNRTPFLPDFPQPIKFSDKENANISRMSGKKIPKPKNADDSLSNIILKACSYNPQERYQTATEMRIALQSVLQSIQQKEKLQVNEEFVVNEKETMILEEEKTRYLFGLNSEDVPKIKEQQLSEITKKEKQKTEIKEKIEQEAEENIDRKTEGKIEQAVIVKKKSNIKREKINKQINNFVTFGKSKVGRYIILIVLFLILGFFGFNLYQTSLNRVVPNVVHMSIEEAEKKLKNEDLDFEITEKINSDEVQRGYVITQNIEKGTVVKKGTKIQIKVSVGPIIYMPNLNNVSQKEAENILKKQGISLKLNKESYSDTVKKGYIISQSIKSNKQVNYGDIVLVEISKGKEQVKVPNVEGLTKSKAIENLKTSKLKYTIKTNYSNSVSSGKVISQSIKAGKTVDKNSNVIIVISQGKKTTTTKKTSKTNSNDKWVDVEVN